MSRQTPSSRPFFLPRSTRIAIAAARFNQPIVDHILDDCTRRLGENGIAQNRIDVHRVPGAFELPVMCKVFCQTERYAAVIALGAIIRGETPHFDLVAHHCTAGLRNVALEFSIPVIFGVLATNTEEQAWERTRGPHSHTGISVADAACEMIEAIKNVREGNDASGARRSWPGFKKSAGKKTGRRTGER